MPSSTHTVVVGFAAMGLAVPPAWRRTRSILAGVLAEAPYFFAVATLSLTLAGLAGLAAALRRGAAPSELDVFRLREIVEFGFTNALLALGTIPLATGLGEAAGVRVVSVLAVAALAADSTLLLRRARTIPDLRRRAIVLPIAVLGAAILAATLIAAASGTVLALEWVVLLNLSRPMLAFTFVLRSLDPGR